MAAHSAPIAQNERMELFAVSAVINAFHDNLEKQKDGPRPHGYAMTNANRNAREERLQVMLLAEEIHAIDDFRFANRMPSRAAAIRELLRRGIAAEGFAVASPGIRSSDYGVTGPSPRGVKNGNGGAAG